ncbi:unnamed protein product [Miscanthus lutarioriparius]|uniref:Secreted protein n=1 Tax=Miscanthus lutarioriparius TaxID=422564 RepID=A0A811R2Q1_9POAL|nr:unnamed protein product [Miscanthus lutarioriparius]
MASSTKTSRLLATLWLTLLLVVSTEKLSVDRAQLVLAFRLRLRTERPHVPDGCIDHVLLGRKRCQDDANGQYGSRTNHKKCAN